MEHRAGGLSTPGNIRRPVWLMKRASWYAKRF
nr:MAG TPA: hypothetical protein [Caudoviricetes sp.]